MLAKVAVASHTPAAEAKRSVSLKTFHVERPADWQNPGNTPDACRKRHETMKRNGTYRKSRPEDELYKYLVQRFGDVERQRYVNGWPIDFYVPSVDAYVQLDGVYWHGLDKPIEQIRQSSRPRDRQIVKKWETDRAQGAWFAAREMRLVRITDAQFLAGERPL